MTRAKALAAPVVVGIMFSCRSRPPQVLVRQIQDALVVGISVDGGHQPFDDAERIVDYLGRWSQTVGGTGGIGDDVMLLGIVLLLIYAQDDGDILIFGWSADDDFLRPGLDVPGCLRGLAKHPGGFHHNAYPQLAPGQFGRVTLGKHFDFLTVDDQIAPLDLHLAGKMAIVRVVFQ